MKKLLLVLGIFTLLFITGCGNKNIEELDVSRAQAIIEGHLEDMRPEGDDVLKDIYGFDLEKMDEWIIKRNKYGDLYAIIKTKDKTTAKNNMNGYFEKIKEFDKNYKPEALEKLENRLEKEIGDYLIYIVSEDAEEIYNEIIEDM